MLMHSVQSQAKLYLNDSLRLRFQRAEGAPLPMRASVTAAFFGLATAVTADRLLVATRPESCAGFSTSGGMKAAWWPPGY
jgi:hypothetical protein